jgi:hypothetical protein
MIQMEDFGFKEDGVEGQKELPYFGLGWNPCEL